MREGISHDIFGAPDPFMLPLSRSGLIILTSRLGLGLLSAHEGEG